MIEGIEPLYQRIADAMLAALPEAWSVAEFNAIFWAEHSTYEAEYVRKSDGVARSFQPTSDGSRAIRELRQTFQQAEHPLWGQIRFVLRPDGTFSVSWGYEGCDANGDTIWDAETERQRHEERRLRLLAGRPNQQT